MLRIKYLNFYDSSETTLAEKGAEVFTVPSLKQFFECILALMKAPLSILCETRYHICFVSLFFEGLLHLHLTQSTLSLPPENIRKS